MGSSRLLAKLPHRRMCTRGRRGQACDLLFACFPFLPNPDMVDPERPQARRVQAGADREIGHSAFNHPTGAGGILGARGVSRPLPGKGCQDQPFPQSTAHLVPQFLPAHLHDPCNLCVYTRTTHHPIRHSLLRPNHDNSSRSKGLID